MLKTNIMKNTALISTIKMFFVFVLFCFVSGILGYYLCKMDMIDRAKTVGYPSQYDYTIEDIEIILFNESQL